MGIWSNEPIKDEKELLLLLNFKRLNDDYIANGGSQVWKRTDPALHKAVLEEAERSKVRYDTQIEEYLNRTGKTIAIK